MKTVEITAEAERLGEQKLIAAQKAAEQDRYRKQVEADVIAYALEKQAQGKRAAAEAEYLAKTRQAQADSEAARMRAEGETAVQMVPVNIARQNVEVESARVEVESQRVAVEARALSNRETYGRAALEFEIAKLGVEASRDTQIATARALGEFLAKANFTLFGDPESAQKMIGAYMKGMGVGRTLDGFIAGSDGIVRETMTKAGGALLDLARAATERIAVEAQVVEVRDDQPPAPANGSHAGS